MIYSTSHKLIINLLIGVLVGVIIGVNNFTELIRLLITFNELFTKFLLYIVPLMIFIFITKGIIELGQKSIPIVLVTIFFSFLFMSSIGIIVVFWDIQLLSKWFVNDNILNMITKLNHIQPYFQFTLIPIMSLSSALILAMFLGTGLAKITNSVLVKSVNEFHFIIEQIIRNIILPMLPLYIAGVFANIIQSKEFFTILMSFSVLFIIIILLQLFVLLLQYIIVGFIVKKNPWRLMKNMIPAYITGLSTQSSMATIPVTIESLKKNGVSDKIAHVIASLNANMYKPGSMVAMVSFAVMFTMVKGAEININQLFIMVLALAIIIILSPGIPGGSVIAASGFLQNYLGLNNNEITMMIILYAIQDSFGTACNVMSDGAVGMLVECSSRHKKL